MHVRVRLYASLRGNHAAEEDIDAPQGAQAGSLLKTLDIPESSVTLIFINGRHALPDAVLAEGDEVAFFPPIGGG
jgi:sulfur-carrier protein